MEPTLTTTSLFILSAMAWLFVFYLVVMIRKRYKEQRSKRAYQEFKSNCKPTIIEKHW